MYTPLAIVSKPLNLLTVDAVVLSLYFIPSLVTASVKKALMGIFDFIVDLISHDNSTIRNRNRACRLKIKGLGISH
jgi:hypothetical protein